MAIGFLTKVKGFLNDSGNNMISSLADTVDRFVQTKDEKDKVKQELLKLQSDFQKSQNNFMLDMECLAQQKEEQLEKSIRQELDAKKEILLAELNQGDQYTKRARPTVVYVGLIFILLEVFGLRHIILEAVADDGAQLQALLDSSDKIFNTFLWAWGGVLGVYSLGRSAEKRGTRSKWESAITGTKTQKKDNTTEAITKDIKKKVKNQIQW
ncbi:MAG: 3TM-type holin [Bacteroidales bacterium]